MPLIVAIHGGTYDSGYFDVPGYSLLDRAEVNGIPVVAIDRPGYGQTPLLARGEMTLAGQAAFLAPALAEVWQQERRDTCGVVIVAHSIGAAIALIMAGGRLDFPLLGLAVSGVGMRTPPDHRAMWEALPDLDRVEIPADLKDQVMFGPPGSHDAEAPAASHAANRPAPRAELVDIVSSWTAMAPGVLERIGVPVHYRQAECDALWINGADEVHDFARALSHAPRIDWAMAPGMGHCLDFHSIGAGFQLQQLGFALECAALRPA